MKKMMNGMAVLCIMALLVGTVSAVTTVDTTWSGSGNLASTVDASGNQKTTFSTGGNVISGQLTVVDQQDNPYNYGVSSVKTYLVATVQGGGLDYVVDRTKSKESMYGAPGQRAYTYAVADANSVIEVATGASSNYASMGVGTYAKPKTTGGYNFRGVGTSFGVQHGVVTSDLDGAELILNGAGTVGINAMSSDIGASSYKFGKGQGCYTNANVVATGSGNFKINAVATNQMKIDAGNVVANGPVIYNMNLNYGSGLTYGNFALEGN